MDIDSKLSLSPLHWHRLTAEMTWNKPATLLRGHPLSLFESVVKAVTSRLYGRDDLLPELVPIFHVRGRKHSMRFRNGERFFVDFIFTRQTLEQVQSWRGLLEEYFTLPENARTVEMVSLGAIEPRNLERLTSEFPDAAKGGEACLEFLIPMPFSTDKNHERTYLSKKTFINACEKRISRLFDRTITYRSNRDDFSLLPYYWNYTEIRHDSHSQPGHVQFIKGCIGKLYIKGDYRDFLPFLLLGSELHAGSKLANSQGYYIFHRESVPFFANMFPDKDAIRSIIRDVLERYDQALASLSKKESYPFNEEEFAEKLCSEIASGAYKPSPATAFQIGKKGEAERLVEQLQYRDLVACQYLLKTVGVFFERFFESESIGFRKGISRQKAVDLVNRAIAEGFCFVIESDIEDFFPSVDLAKLKQLLEFYFPSKDALINKIFQNVIENGFVLNGVYHERLNGLAQGNPLSPLLANLYLDSFDEEIKTYDARLVRYADDFVILARNREDAEILLSRSGSFLAVLGLKLKKEKTAIKSVKEGFQFLGMRFQGFEVAATGENESKSLKKPLYITEPYLFLSLENDAVDVMKYGKLLESIPLRRVSEIMVMEKTVFSTALIRKCVEFNIPMSITLNSGYYITTIKPDSKKYYAIVTEHGRRHQALSDTEVLCIAREFAAGKVAGYRTLFSQRYVREQNVFIRELERFTARMREAGDLNQLRGLEGLCARKVFPRLNLLINDPLFHIKTRDRKNPDRINSLLNFGYYLLFSRLNAIVRSAGLNPYLGFLHSPRDDYESLVCDIEELFRARVDRFIIRLVNLKVITPDDFSESERGFYLSREAAKKYLAHFESELDRKPKNGGLTLKEHFYVQVDVFKKWLLANGSLTFYEWRA